MARQPSHKEILTPSWPHSPLHVRFLYHPISYDEEQLALEQPTQFVLLVTSDELDSVVTSALHTGQTCQKIIQVIT